MSAKCRDPSLPAVPVDSGEAEAPAATDPSRVVAMVAAVENFKDDDHESGRFFVLWLRASFSRREKQENHQLCWWLLRL